MKHRSIGFFQELTHSSLKIWLIELNIFNSVFITELLWHSLKDGGVLIFYLFIVSTKLLSFTAITCSTCQHLCEQKARESRYTLLILTWSITGIQFFNSSFDNLTKCDVCLTVHWSSVDKQIFLVSLTLSHCSCIYIISN